jgi:hypothetical protein
MIRSKECSYSQGMVVMMETQDIRAAKFSDYPDQTGKHFKDGCHT